MIEFRDRLRRLERIILSRVRESSYCSGLTVNQGHILICLDRRGGSPMTGLNEELRLDKASLSRTVSLLLELTEGGREFVRKLDRASLFVSGEYTPVWTSISEGI